MLLPLKNFVEALDPYELHIGRILRYKKWIFEIFTNDSSVQDKCFVTELPAGLPD